MNVPQQELSSGPPRGPWRDDYLKNSPKVIPNPKAKLLDQVREVLRVKHYAIRTEEVTKAVTSVASNPKVREVMVEHQRAWITNNGGGVLEGRDIGTVVCPDATVKVYLVADAEVRAQRRAAEHGDAVAQDMRRRDQADSTRDVSPLMRADDAVEIDTTHMSVDDVVDVVIGLLP